MPIDLFKVDLYFEFYINYEKFKKYLCFWFKYSVRLNCINIIKYNFVRNIFRNSMA